MASRVGNGRVIDKIREIIERFRVLLLMIEHLILDSAGSKSGVLGRRVFEHWEVLCV